MPRSSPVARTGDLSRPARSKSATKPVAQAVAEGFAPVCIAPSLPPVAPPADLPRILFIEQLASLIGKTETTIRTCATNAKYAHLIPRPFKLPKGTALLTALDKAFAELARLNSSTMARLAVYGTYCWTCLRSVRLHTVASLERSAAKACSRGCAVNCERKLSMSPNTRSSIMLTRP